MHLPNPHLIGHFAFYAALLVTPVFGQAPTMTPKLLYQIDAIRDSEQGTDQFGKGIFAIGDIDQDGANDFGVTSQPKNSVEIPTGEDTHFRVYSGRNGTLIYDIPNGIGRETRAYPKCFDTLGDLDGDAIPDFILGDWGTHQAKIISGKDGSTIRYHHGPEIENPSHTLGLGHLVTTVGDIDLDGFQDYALPTHSHAFRSRSDSLFYNNNNIAIHSGQTGDLIFSVSKSVRYVATGITSMGDLNGDGVPDFATIAGDETRDYAPQIVFVSGKLRGSITADDLLANQVVPAHDPWFAGPLDTISAFRFWGPADLDGDGLRDLVYSVTVFPSPYESHYVAISSQDGRTIWDTRELNPPMVADAYGFTIGSIAVIGDLDGDGVQDLATRHRRNFSSPYKFVVHSGRSGDVLFAMPLDAYQKQNPEDFGARTIAAIGDLDGDGISEIAIDQHERRFEGRFVDPSFPGRVEVYSIGPASQSTKPRDPTLSASTYRNSLSLSWPAASTQEMVLQRSADLIHWEPFDDYDFPGSGFVAIPQSGLSSKGFFRLAPLSLE